MNQTVVLAFISTILAFCHAGPIESIVDVTEDTLGNYRYAFDSGDFSKAETRHQDGSVKGKFTFTDPEGIKHTVEYDAAAEQGVIAEGADLPAPVADTAENEAARKQFLEVYGAVASDPRFAESPSDEKEDPISGDEYLAAVQEQVKPSVPLVFQEDTPEIAAAKDLLIAAHATVVGQ
ncbi:hypothetical protein Trydic_g12457 [Trypoxylus dichotomus]